MVVVIVVVTQWSCKVRPGRAPARGRSYLAAPARRPARMALLAEPKRHSGLALALFSTCTQRLEYSIIGIVLNMVLFQDSCLHFEGGFWQTLLLNLPDSAFSGA